LTGVKLIEYKLVVVPTGRRGRTFIMDRSFRRPFGSRGGRRPYYSQGNKGRAPQRGGCVINFF